MVCGCGSTSLVTSGTPSAEVLSALNTEHGAIIILAEIAFHHPVDISSGTLLGLGERVDEGNALK